jgi:triosephosphate isomerase (TIM)
MTRPLLVGNWKMNGTQHQCQELARKIAKELPANTSAVEVAVAPPFTALSSVAQIKGDLKLAAQNCHWQESGAFTGEISPNMLSELGCEFVILGHSERRHVFHEDDDMISRKLDPVISDGMRAILCVGETLSERERGITDEVITRQLHAALKALNKGAIKALEIAYEPVWAIGTGHNASSQQISAVHSQIRELLIGSFGDSGRQVRILYGGSVKPENALTLAQIDEVNGLLVGGASLQAETFIAIVSAFTKTEAR